MTFTYESLIDARKAYVRDVTLRHEAAAIVATHALNLAQDFAGGLEVLEGLFFESTDQEREDFVKDAGLAGTYFDAGVALFQDLSTYDTLLQAHRHMAKSLVQPGAA